jgi:hypothetical protein
MVLVEPREVNKRLTKQFHAFFMCNNLKNPTTARPPSYTKQNRNCPKKREKEQLLSKKTGKTCKAVLEQE